MELSQDAGFPDAPIRHCPACVQTLPAYLFVCFRCGVYLMVDGDNGALDMRPNTLEEAREAVVEARKEGGGSASVDDPTSVGTASVGGAPVAPWSTSVDVGPGQAVLEGILSSAR
eukprot:4547888-Lingulodinium_polyedra.AAC.1